MIIKLVVKKENESWYKNGVLHRDEAPALITNEGSSIFFIEGRRKGWYHKDE